MLVVVVLIFVLALSGCGFFGNKPAINNRLLDEQPSEVRTREVELEKLEADFESFKEERKKAGSLE